METKPIVQVNPYHMEGLKMIKMSEIELCDLLPSNLKDKPENIALSFAVKQVMQKLNEKIELTYLYYNLDKQPDAILDHMAAELRTQYYNSSLPRETKVNLIKNTLHWYQTLGTPSAVEEVIQTVFGAGELEEWFEYGGEPYHFRVATEEIITEENTEKIANMIERVKNKRSILDGLNKLQNLRPDIHAGIGMVTYKWIGIGVDESA